MTVEMNPSSACSQRRSDSVKVKRNKMGVQDFDDRERRLSDDLYSLNSWSENLSTSSSSDSVLHHNTSSSRYGGQSRDVNAKTKTSFEKILHNGQIQKKKLHNSMKTGSTLLSSKMSNLEFESAAVPSSANNYEHQYEAPICDPDISVFMKHYDIDTVDGSHQHIKVNNSDIVGKNVVGVSVDDKHTEPLVPTTLQAQKLYPDLEAMKHLDSQRNVLEVFPSSSAKNNVSGSAQSRMQRHSFFDFQKLPKHHSRNVQAHSDDTNSELFAFSPSASHTSQQNSDVFRHFGRYNTVDDRKSQQNAAKLAGRLHKSQPSIASEPKLTRLPKSSNDLESLRLSFEHRLEPENVKTKVKSVWNNIKYGWSFKSKPSFKCDSPLFILGKCYHKQKDDPSMEIENQFLRDFVSRIWLTYRTNFYPIPGTKLITDCGWGCMLRTGQMLIAQCLVTHFLGRDWRLYNKQTESDSVYYREILRWFSDPIDTPSDKSPFCLHHLANFGRIYNKDPGEWYGPASAAYIFRDAFTKARHTVPILSQLCIYVAQDCTVYIDDVLKMCTERHKSESVSSSSDGDCGVASSCEEAMNDKWQRSLIILIPIRLGGEVMNEIYIPCVQGLLSQDNCMGIIGGKPRHSLFFIGWQDDQLIYLDPHLCREAVDTSVSNFRIESYHCMTPRKLSISKMDPSCTVGFYIRDGDDFKKFVSEIKKFVCPPKQKGAYPLFIFADGHLNESSAKQNHSAADRRVKVTHYHVDQNGQRHRAFSETSEDFVML